MRRAAALIFALCGLLLLLTWHHDGQWLWLWGWGRSLVTMAKYSFSLGEMSSLDFVLKIAGLAFVALALLLFRPAASRTE